MCAPAIGAAIGAIGSVVGGIMAQQQANYQAKVAEINATSAYQEGVAQAGATRDQFAEVKGAQVAALAKSGVDINSGTSQVLALETQRREEVAAAVDIWRGRTEQTKWLNQAKVAKAEGKAALVGGMGQGTPLKLGQAAPMVTGRAAGGIAPAVRAAGRIPLGSLTYGGPR